MLETLVTLAYTVLAVNLKSIRPQASLQLILFCPRVKDFPKYDSPWLFIGLTSYYWSFIKNYAQVAGPLHTLIGMNWPFVWDNACQTAYEELKRLLTTTPVLIFPDFNRSFILKTDASIKGLGELSWPRS